MAKTSKPKLTKPSKTKSKLAKTSKSKLAKQSKTTSRPKKDYAYRSTWKHKYSRARNKERRGGLTKKEMFARGLGFPRGKEWRGVDENEKEWAKKWIAANPKY